MEKTSYDSPLEIKSIGEAAREEAQYIDDRRKGNIKSLRTPWEKYNEVSMQGIEWHTMHSIAGMSGSGKTAILNQLETELCHLNPDQNMCILSFNFEMLARNLVGRKMSKELGVTLQKLHSGVKDQLLTDEEYQKVLSAEEKFKNYPIYYVDEAGTVEDIIKTLYAFHRKHPDKGILMTLDHTLLVNGSASEVERIVLVNLVKALKAAIKYFKSINVNFSVVLLSQLNRSIEEPERSAEPGSQNFPKKKDIFGGDALYQMSDIVMVTMNPHQQGMVAYGPRKWPTQGYLYWHFLKVREGEPRIAVMTNKLAINTIEDYVMPKQANTLDLNN